MAKLYHVDIARHAASADGKWVDNLLSHFNLPGVEGGVQGSPRRITADGIHHIALVRLLTRDLGLSAAAAVPLAARLLSDVTATIAFPDGLELRLDLNRFQGEIRRMVAEAVESVTPARRGRPPKSSNQ